MSDYWRIRFGFAGTISRMMTCGSALGAGGGQAASFKTGFQ